jgi:glycosyltransferase involved in cell wall biosynthesis
VFSIIIPTFNNLPYLKNCIKSINNTSRLDNEIIVHVNEDLKGDTRDYLFKNHIHYTFSKNNIGLCSSINLAVKSSSYKYILYTHDDMYFCPGWEGPLVNEINKINHTLFYISGSMIEANSGHIPYDCGNSLESFDEEKLLNNYMNLNIDDHQGSHFSPHCTHIDIWNKVGGFSEEFNPGMGSDPDFNMKLWKKGVRIFKGLGQCRVYHFSSITLRKSNTTNNGAKTFLLKWGITIKFFKKFYLRTNEKYIRELVDPKKNMIYYFSLLRCKFQYIYYKIVG